MAAQGDNLEGAREVAAMQFAGGMSIARLAEDWERDAAWVEESIRMALLDSIPRRSGGRKLPRTELRKARRLQIVGSDMEQPTLEW